jgi:hypothetical protein
MDLQGNFVTNMKIFLNAAPVDLAELSVIELSEKSSSAANKSRS